MHPLALTFDDGPGPSTGPLLDVLARHRARATFFLVGASLRGAALDGDGAFACALALRALAEGHTVGNHTDTHARDLLPDGALAAEITRTDTLLGELHRQAGVPVPSRHPFRLPYGPLVRTRDDGTPTLDERLTVLASLGRTHHHWTGIFDDWEPATRADTLFRRLLDHVRTVWAQGAMPVLALHDAGTRRRSNGFDRGATVAAVDALCTALAEAGTPPRYVTLT